jgi:hypothetical protein
MKKRWLKPSTETEVLATFSKVREKLQSFEKVKLQVDLTMSEQHHQIVISQEMAPCFREWISEL